MTDNSSTLKGLGGWFIVVAIKLILTCIGYLFLAIYTLITIGEWSKFINLTSEYYSENFVWIFPIEVGANAIIICFNIYLLYLFFTKNYKFPSLMICFELVLIVLTLLDTFITYEFTRFKIEIHDIASNVRTIIWSIIYISYILKSVRVKNTFVNGRRNEENHSNIIS
jgi:hypothetical protein